MDINVCCTILVSFLWAVIYILYKKISNCNIDLLSFGLSKFFIMGIIAGLLYLFYKKNNEIFQNIEQNTFFYLILLSILEVICVFLFIYAIKDKDVVWIVPITEALIILFSFLLSIYFFSEKITVNKNLGILFLLIGIYFINY